MQLGDPDGHGVHGRLTVLDDGDRVLCHDCGAHVRSLGVHARRVHQISAEDYRAQHGLAVTAPLTAPTTRARHSDHARTNPAARAALEDHRDPDAARAAMRGRQARPARAAVRTATGQTARRGRRLTDDETTALQDAPSIAGWAAIAHQLIDTGVRAAEIARTLDLPRATVHQRLHRHPADADTDDALAGLYGAGLSTARAAAAAGLTTSTARKRLLDAGVTLRAATTLPDGVTLDVDRWARWYTDGIGAAAIAQRAGTTTPTVLTHLRAAGVTIRPPSAPPADATVDPRLWAAWYADGLSARTIATRSGVTPPTVLKHLRRAGVTIRPRGT